MRNWLKYNSHRTIRPDPGSNGLGINGPGQTVWGQTISGQTVSGQTVSGQTISGQTVLGQTVSGQTVLGQTVTAQTLLRTNYLGTNCLGTNHLGTVPGQIITGPFDFSLSLPFQKKKFSYDSITFSPKISNTKGMMDWWWVPKNKTNQSKIALQQRASHNNSSFPERWDVAKGFFSHIISINMPEKSSSRTRRRPYCPVSIVHSQLSHFFASCHCRSSKLKWNYFSAKMKKEQYVIVGVEIMMAQRDF